MEALPGLSALCDHGDNFSRTACLSDYSVSDSVQKDETPSADSINEKYVISFFGVDGQSCRWLGVGQTCIKKWSARLISIDKRKVVDFVVPVAEWLPRDSYIIVNLVLDFMLDMSRSGVRPPVGTLLFVLTPSNQPS